MNDVVSVSSTILPRYITATRWLMCWTTAKSWAMMRGQSEPVLQILMRLMICAWIETSSAETGSSPMISFGLERKGPGDANALTWPPENSCG